MTTTKTKEAAAKADATKDTETKNLPAVAGPAQLPAEFVGSLTGDAGRGSENAGAEDQALPFIKCAQAISKEVQSRESVFIKDLQVGDFFNSVSKRIWPGENGFDFLPVFYIRQYLEWGPKRGDGFKGSHGPEILKKATRDDKGVYRLESGNVITIAATWYGYIVDKATGDTEAAILSLASTQLKKSRGLMYNIKNVRLANPAGGTFNPPIFAHLVHVTSVPESNAQGNWYGVNLTLDQLGVTRLPNAQAVYERAKALYEMAASGKVREASRTEEDIIDAEAEEVDESSDNKAAF